MSATAPLKPILTHVTQPLQLLVTIIALFPTRLNPTVNLRVCNFLLSMFRTLIDKSVLLYGLGE